LQFDALTAFSKAFDYSMENRMTVVGTLRFFNTRVLANSGDRGGAVETCVDESQLRKRSRRTGKTVPTIKTKRDRFYKVISGMRRGDDGVWRMSEFLTYNLPDSRAKECQQ
jgi:hypothetical protein